MRLIDADEFRKRIDHYPPDIRDIAKKELRYAKTIEAEPVRHGHWIKGEKIYPDMLNDSTYGYWCSECHHMDVHGDNVEVLFCWHCGAKMDEVNDGSNNNK